MPTAKAAIVMLSPGYFASQPCASELASLVTSRDFLSKMIPVIVADPDEVKNLTQHDNLKQWLEVNRRPVEADKLATCVNSFVHTNWLPPPNDVFGTDEEANCRKLLEVLKEMCPELFPESSA